MATATVANPSTSRKPSKAFYADLDGVYGVALRASDNTVHFQAEATGLWQQLTNAHIPQLTLYGEIAVAQAQWQADGDIYGWVERRNTEHARVAA